MTGRDHMSPYVWRQADGRLGIMVRAVPPLDGPADRHRRGLGTGPATTASALG